MFDFNLSLDITTQSRQLPHPHPHPGFIKIQAMPLFPLKSMAKYSLISMATWLSPKSESEIGYVLGEFHARFMEVRSLNGS